ncbi:BrnA antitoxin family protein [Pollutimonas bauzanensis]|uniref:BrnA antitoxin of type II toxin-antitoxin system n=1 Tax=Pollutimonas bauzanensis TaxID=658167 RepID=A0A1M5PRE9_9BURK|nr:BrnA antitoxin family protein [Pollutimonas bauzanensis]SHH04261.1 BrnA antitoxin of type II toxin-antitoxin system [Pollutimonas bauzanensis]
MRERPDEGIDYSEQPALDEVFWTQALRNPLNRPTKTSTTVRIDSDVLAWLRSQGKGYQSRINAILRKEMLASIK